MRDERADDCCGEAAGVTAFEDGADTTISLFTFDWRRLGSFVRSGHPGHGADAKKEAPATVLNALMQLTRAGGSIGIPGLYVTDDPGGVDAAPKVGALSIRLGLGWAKSLSFQTGQTPVLKYNRQLMEAILHDKVQIAKAVNVTVITLDDGPKGYVDFDKGVAKKFVIDPHGLLAA